MDMEMGTHSGFGSWQVGGRSPVLPAFCGIHLCVLNLETKSRNEENARVTQLQELHPSEAVPKFSVGTGAAYTWQ